MSLAVCLKNKDTIIMATDSSEIFTGGDIVIRDNVKKIDQWSKSIALTIIGNNVAFGNWLLSYAREKINEEQQAKLNYSETISQFATILREQNASHASAPDKPISLDDSVEFILCGFDTRGIPKINILYNLHRSPFCPLNPNKDYFVGGHDTVALHNIKKIDNVLPIHELNEGALKRLAVYLVCEVAETDDDVKLPPQMVILKPNRPVEFAPQGELDPIIASMRPIVSSPQMIQAILGK